MERDTTLRAGIIVSIIFAVSALLGFFRDVALAAFFGASHQADALLVAMIIPEFFSSMLSEASLGVAIVPVFMSYIAPQKTREQREIIGSAFTLLSLVLVPITLLVVLAAPLLARIFAPGFRPADTQLTVQLMRVMLPSIFFLGLANLATGILFAVKRFGAASATAAVLNLSIVLSTVSLANRFGIVAPAIGVLVGNILQLGVQLPSLVRTGLVPSIGFRFRHPALRRMWSLFWPILAGALASNVVNVAQKIVASFLPSGSIAALTFAEKIAGGPSRIFAMAVATVVFPSLAQQVSENSSDTARTLTTGLTSAAVLTIPWLAIFMGLRTPIVRVLLQRGAFDARATAMVAFPMAIYCFGEYGNGIATSINRAFYSYHDSRTPTVIRIILKSLGVLIAIPLIPWLSQGAIALGSVVGINLTVAVLLVRLRRNMPELDLFALTKTLARITAVSAVGAVVAWLVYSTGVASLGITSTVRMALMLSVSGIAGFVVFVAGARVAGISEVSELQSRVVNLFRRRSPG